MLSKAQVVSFLAEFQDRLEADSDYDYAVSVFDNFEDVTGHTITVGNLMLTLEIISLDIDINQTSDIKWTYFSFKEHPNQYWRVGFTFETWGNPWGAIETIQEVVIAMVPIMTFEVKAEVGMDA